MIKESTPNKSYDMKNHYQSGKTSWFSIIGWLIFAAWLFDLWAIEDGEIHINLPKIRVTQIVKDESGKTIKETSPKEQHREKQTKEKKEIKSKEPYDDLQPEYIDNGWKELSLVLDPPISKEFTLKKDLDGTIWACKPNIKICFKVKTNEE